MHEETTKELRELWKKRKLEKKQKAADIRFIGLIVIFLPVIVFTGYGLMTGDFLRFLITSGVSTLITIVGLELMSTGDDIEN